MTTNMFLTAVITGVLASSATAQTTAFDGAGGADSAIEDLEDAIEDDAERDIDGFGTEGREIGSYGSLAFRSISTSNDGDTENTVGVGMRYGWFDGINGVDTNLSFAYGEENGTQSENRLLVGLDYRRNLSEAFFVYGQLDLSFDRLTTTEGEYSQDAFAGAGLGYRIYNTADVQWSVQAGPGYRVADVVGGESVSEVAASVSSNLFYSLTDSVYVTNDTDVIYSEFATTIANDFAVSVALSDSLSLRTSYATRFNDETDDSFSDGENTLGVSVVYNFN